MTESHETADQPVVSPVRRSWHAITLMVPLFTLFYVPTLGLIDSMSTTTEMFADLAYAVVTMVGYVAAVAVLIPVGAFTIGRWLDGATRDWARWRAALVFAATAGGVGLLAAVPMLNDGGFGMLPLLSFVFAPALAAFFTRVLLETVAISRLVRVSAVVLTALVALAMVAIAAQIVVANVA